MKRHYIYSLSKHDVVFYIGTTTNIELREKDHRVYYGDDIVLTVLDTHDGSLDAATSIETSWIKKYRDAGVKLINKKQSTPTRTPKSYKIPQDIYNKASVRAKRERTTVANLVEEWLTDYSNGYSIKSIGIL